MSNYSYTAIEDGQLFLEVIRNREVTTLNIPNNPLSIIEKVLWLYNQKESVGDARILDQLKQDRSYPVESLRLMVRSERGNIYYLKELNTIGQIYLLVNELRLNSEHIFIYPMLIK